MHPHQIIDSIYAKQPALRQLLIIHSENVAKKALETIHNAGIAADTRFIYEAAMLHDIGIIRTNAKDIHCFGNLPYICHGIAGREILESLGFPMHALVCERHTGSGLTISDIVQQNLPLPHRDMCPISLEEKVICYADKFFSKSSNPNNEKSLEKVIASMKRHGKDSLERFLALHTLFSS
ncbi:MAG: HDIG domain-containing protein [Prevotella sp.]|nr:HDIG domain-containing protein [Bacteroides sp.]MCM1366759.1 HDIG domain-containing protein [Prevotella sp.]MCM1437378.1 HDIG domain-containing protein [Prevotella sp.]